MPKSLHFDFHNIGAYDGETEHRIICDFYSVKDGIVWPGQSQIMPVSQWQTYRAYLEAGGWTYRRHRYFQGRA